MNKSNVQYIDRIEMDLVGRLRTFRPKIHQLTSNDISIILQICFSFIFVPTKSHFLPLVFLYSNLIFNESVSIRSDHSMHSHFIQIVRSQYTEGKKAWPQPVGT